ncbi:MAG: hypothetical protein E3J35_10050 [Methanomassiliicoccales archaeon]|nr:MAG: hypothetical protein E3J35_10050 [Methanomassiliicoccales archaeon]
MHREKTLGNFERLKRYFQERSHVEIDEEDIFILASALENPLTMEEMCYSIGLKQVTCIAKVRKLMKAGLLDRSRSPKGKKRGGLIVYQLSDNIVSDFNSTKEAENVSHAP